MTLDKIIVIGERCRENRALTEAIHKYKEKKEICYMETAADYVLDDEHVIIYDGFNDHVFESLSRSRSVIVSPQMFIKSANADPPKVPCYRRPLYNESMKGVIICFTGFQERAHVSKLAALVHYMAGAIRQEFSPKITHLVANHCKGSKYKSAVNLGRPVMLENWILQLWDKRDNPLIHADDPEMMMNKAPVFLRCGLAFHGFTQSDLREMEDVAIGNGATLCNIGDSECTHIVCDNSQTLPGDISSRLMVVKVEWFWASVQIEACANELLYGIEDTVQENRSGFQLTPGRRTPGSRSKKRKRYLRENLAALANEGEATTSYKSRRSSVDQLSISRCSADLTPDNSACLLDTPSPRSTMKVISPTPEKQTKQSARKLVVGELLTTERNYCKVLNTVLSICRDGAVDPGQPGGPILSQADSKIIFGGIPPILEIHEIIKAELEKILEGWSEDITVANIVLDKVDNLRQSYPPFVNYMDNTKNKIEECTKTNHRFHAFLKMCQMKPDFGRQTLPDLLMNIVQRLPRVELLLQQIHKYTDKKCHDYVLLERAQQELKSVMTHINEDKKLTDERMVLFDLMNDIDNPPPQLLSASRNLVLRLDCYEVCCYDNLTSKGEAVTLFLFTDCLEIVKRRSNKQTGSTGFKSPASRRMSIAVRNSNKPFKHVEFLTLQSIKRIINLTLAADGNVEDGCGDDSHLFSLVCRQVTDSREKLYTFQLSDENIDKISFITSMAKSIANISCRTDYETLITVKPAADFMIKPLDISTNNKTLSRTVSKFGKRLGRAMTIKGMSSPLKRAVSTVITPTRKSSFRATSESMCGSVQCLSEMGDSPIYSTSIESPSIQSFATLPRNTSTISTLQNSDNTPVVPPRTRKTTLLTSTKKL